MLKVKYGHRYSSSVGSNLLMKSNSQRQSTATKSKKTNGMTKENSTLSDIFGRSHTVSNLKQSKKPEEAVAGPLSYDQMNFDKPPDLTNIDNYFKNQLFDTIGIADLESRRTSLQMKVLKRNCKDEFDNNEAKFCKRLMNVKRISEVPPSNTVRDDCFSDLNLNHKLIDTDTRVSEGLRRLDESKRATEVKRMEKQTRDQWKQRDGPDLLSRRMAEVIFKHKKVFQVENVVMLKRRMEKDPAIGDTITKSIDQFQNKVSQLSKAAISRNVQKWNHGSMIELVKENQKCGRASSRTERMNFGAPEGNSAITSRAIFNPNRLSRMAFTTKGLHERNRKFNIITLNDLVEAMLHDKKMEREEEKLKMLEISLEQEFDA